MTLFRVEVNVESGVRADIYQIPYKNSDGEVLVLDAELSPPAGFTEFDPTLVEDEELDV